MNKWLARGLKATGLWGIKETVGFGGGVVAQAAIAPEPGTQHEDLSKRIAEAGEDGIRRPFAAFVDVYDQAKNEVAKIFSRGSGLSAHVTAHHAAIVNAAARVAELHSGDAYVVGMLAASAGAVTAIKGTKYMIKRHQRGDERALHELPKAARNEVLHALTEHRDALVLDSAERDTITMLEKIVNHKGSYGITGEGEDAAYAFSHKPQNKISPVTMKLQMQLAGILKKYEDLNNAKLMETIEVITTLAAGKDGPKPDAGMSAAYKTALAQQAAEAARNPQGAEVTGKPVADRTPAKPAKPAKAFRPKALRPVGVG